MATKFEITETIHSEPVHTVRLGDTGTGVYTDTEVGKAVKLTAASRYELCDAGDPIEGVISSVNGGTFDGYSVGGIVSSGYKAVTLDGAIAIGEYVVTGTVVAEGTALTGPLKVIKATDQAAAAAAPFKARLVQAESTAVGTLGIVELI